MAETRLRAPALGASVAGVPVALGGAGGPPAAVGAPPVAIAAAALPGRVASRAANATVKMMPANLGRAFAVPGTTLPLFRPPAELAVGLALKESRYERFRPIRPRDLQESLRFPRSHPDSPDGIRRVGEQYKHHPARKSVEVRGAG